MSFKKEPPKLEFLPIQDASLIARILEITDRQQLPIVLWFKNHPERFDARFSQYLPKLRKLSIALRSHSQEFCLLLAAKASNEILFSFQLNSILFFVKTNVLERGEAPIFSLAVPKEIYKLQRRKSLRIPFERREAPKVGVCDTKKNISLETKIDEQDWWWFRLLDLSEGGIAISAAPEYAELLSKDQYIYRLKFQLRGAEIVTEGYVRHSTPSINDHGQPIHKVGIQFFRLSPHFEKIIHLFIVEESRGLFSLL